MRSRLLHSIFTLAILMICGVSSRAQTYLPGQVVDVLDGRTMIVAVTNGTIKIQLDHIEVPAVGHPLNETVRSHLKDLALGKPVLYRPRLLSPDRTVGQVILKGVDLSQQMIRDGAAWHLPIALSGQASADHAAFDALQQAAKQDRLGIWAHPERPSWETRKEIAAVKASASVAATVPEAVRKATKVRPGKWGDVNPRLANVGALYSGYNAAFGTGFLSTGISMVNLNNAALDERFRNAKLYADITYWYTETESKGRTGTFVFTLISENDSPMFARDQELQLYGEKGKISIGRGKRLESRSDGKVFEKLTFDISRSNMERIANDATIMKIADHVLEPQTIRYILYTMLQSV